MVSRVVLLDAGPLGLVTNPNRSPRQSRVPDGCKGWSPPVPRDRTRDCRLRSAPGTAASQQTQRNRTVGCAARLLEYVPITTAAMHQAAYFWAQARQQGQPTAGDKTLDADMILAAQAITLGVSDVVIATTNVGHLSRFAPAELWQDIQTA